MKSVLLATSLMAVLVSSNPLDKRYYVTETDIYTVTVTETGSEAGATGGWGGWGKWGNWGQWSTPADPATPTTTTTSNGWGQWSTSTDPATPTTTTTSDGWDPASPTTTATSNAWVASSYSTPAAAASTPASTTTTSAAAAWSSSSVSSYAQAILDQHNIHRSNHSANPLVWDDDLANTAQTIGQSCVYAHDTTTNGGGYGQNIGAGASPSGVPALITDEMYNNEIGFFPLPYGQAQPDMSNFEEWGHFSQIVWQSTTSIGCATVDCSASGLANTGAGVAPWFTVCNYKPPGNFAGEYGSNIAQPKGDPTVTI